MLIVVEALPCAPRLSTTVSVKASPSNMGRENVRHAFDYCEELTKANGTYDPPPLKATNYDAAHYPSWFVVGRGDLMAVRRYNCENSTTAYDDNQAVWLQINGYNLAGSLVWRQDGGGHRVNIGYGDSFSDDNNSRGTLAYPTTLTDADGYQSFTQYNYDFGAQTRVQGPPPNNQPNGVVQTLAYDSAARLEQVTTVNTGAYTSYVYAPNYTKRISSVNNVADEAYSVQVFDGTGRAFETASYNPGSQGEYSAVSFVYDQMGRLVKQSNPTEINGNWVPAGDDAAGWIYTQQTYDWKGRPLVTNQDGTLKYASYSACGCAGSEVVTLTDEVGRQQKVYRDVLGRTAKTEVLNWDSTIYATTVNTYNAGDQVTLVRQFQGTAPSDPNDQSCPDGTCQKTTVGYDGYGRLQSEHVPEQNAGTATVYAYNPDDTVYSVTDARGASATYGYNNRHLVTAINYYAPYGVASTSNVSFGYDAVGNRTSMTDGLGSKSYNYNQLSQLMSETRTFDVGTFTLNYDYNLAGELKKITDATNMTINYGYDNIGRVNGVTGSDNLYANVSNYASNFQYRAWGGLKAMTDGTSHSSVVGYNSRLQINHFDISGSVANQNYDYYDDGRIKYVHNTTDISFDRSYSYDHVGRLSAASSGGVARGEPTQTQTPYQEIFGYDAFSNLNYRYTGAASQLNSYNYSTYTNNRHNDWGYDTDGRNTNLDGRGYTFDAAGQMTSMTGNMYTGGNHISATMNESYDGDGAKAKEVSSDTATTTTYYLTSSVLGGAIIEEMNASGQKQVGYVYAGGQLLAQQASNLVTWKHNNPIGTSQYNTLTTSNWNRTEVDPLGADVTTPVPAPPDSFSEGNFEQGRFGGIMSSRFSGLLSSSGGCTIDGAKGDCGLAMAQLNSGAAKLLPSGLLTIQLHWDHSTGDLLINGTNQVIGDNGSVSTRKWVKDHPENKPHPNPGPDVIVTNINGVASGHWEDVLVSLGFDLPQNTNRRMTGDEVQTIRGKVAGLLTDACKSFIDNLVQAATGSSYNSGKSLLTDFDRAASQPEGGFYFGPTQLSGSQWGSFAKGNSHIKINESMSWLAGGTNALYAGFTALHELIHAITDAGDPELAKAVFGIGKGKGPVPTDADLKQDPYAYSRYWDDALKSACMPKGY